MERPMSIVLMDETTPATHTDLLHLVREDAADPEPSGAPEPQPVPSTQAQDADAGSPSADHPMRLPSFDESCPHVRDHIIAMNGGHFNVDHYLRVLRAKVEGDVSVAMAMTGVGKRKTATPPSSRLVFLSGTEHLGGAP